MYKKITILIVFLPLLLFASNMGDNYILLTVQGEIEVREPFQKDWQSAFDGLNLHERMTIRSQSRSSATIRACDGSVFQLPPESQIESGELKRMTRDDVIMELTALEMQKLPKKNGTFKQQTAFVLHGSITDTMDLDNCEQYIQLEKNGALALFRQNYFAGFIIKWNRLKCAFPNLKSEKVNYALIRAYQIMDMPVRLNKLVQELEIEK
jgi:hypothetical protein